MSAESIEKENINSYPVFEKGYLGYECMPYFVTASFTPKAEELVKIFNK